MAEAAHHIANVAAKTAWHDKQNTEPLSGASGDVSKGEPFDAGNLDPDSQEKLGRSMSGQDSNPNYNTTGNNSGAQQFDQSKGTGSAPGATLVGGNATATNMHGVPSDGTAGVSSSTRDTGFGVDPDNSKDFSGSNTRAANTSSSGAALGNSTAPVGASTNYAGSANSRGAAGAAAGSFAGVNTTSDVPSSTRNTGYGTDPNLSRDISGSNTYSGGNAQTSSNTHNSGTSSAHIPVSASAPTGSNNSNSHQTSSGAGAALGTAALGSAAATGSGASPSTRDTGYGLDPSQSREISGSDAHRSSNANTASSHSHSHQTARSAAAGAAGAAGVAASTTAGTSSDVPSSTRDTGYGADPDNSSNLDTTSSSGFNNAIAPNTKLADPSSTSRDFSGNNNEKRDISDNASTRALASDSNRDLPSTDDSTNPEGRNNSNPEEEPVDVDGPGPRPVAEVAAEHGGDAGQASEEASTSSGKKSGGLAGEHDNTDHLKHEDAKVEGTGEKWVKTSGLAADGGDFDATKPGAGREADRLMGQKGIKTDGGDVKDSKDLGPKDHSHKDHDHGSKEKPGIVDRIKEKLHKH